MRPLTIIAHRGASEDAPENTFASFDLALEQGADEMELDVHLSRDGVPVVIHDDRLERRTDGKGPVRARTVEELRGLDAGVWFHEKFRGQPIPTLCEVLERYADRLILNVELKGRDKELAGQAARLVMRQDLLDRVVFLSFSPSRITEVLRLIPRQPTSFLVYGFTVKQIEKAQQLGARSVAPPARSVTQDGVDLARSMGLSVWTWDVRSREDLLRTVEAGCTGCAVDWPKRAFLMMARIVEESEGGSQL